MTSAKKFVLTIAAGYEGQSELKKLQYDLKTIGQIDSFEKLRVSSKKVEEALVLARKEASDLGQAMMRGEDGAEKRYAGAVRQVAKLTKTFAKQKGEMSGLEMALKKQGIAVSGLAEAHKKLKDSSAGQGTLLAAQMKLGIRSIKSVESEIEGLHRAYHTLRKSGTQSVKELAVAKDRLREKVALLRQETNGWPSHLGKIQEGWGGLLATAGSVAAAFRGLQFFAGFDDSMREVQAFTRASASEMQKFTALSEHLGTTTRHTATQVAQGMAELTQSGVKTYREMETILPSVTSLTSATGLQFKETADMLTDTMKQFGLATSESGRVADVIAEGYTSAGHSAGQLGAALSYVGPVAKQMGYSLEQTVAIIDTLAEAGYKGQRGGVALRGGFTRLIKPVGEAADVLDKYKIKVEDSQGKTRNFADIIGDLAGASLTTKEMMILFGQEAGPGMMALVDQGADAIRGFQVTMENAGGASERIAATMEAGIGGSLRSLTSSLQAIVIAFGDSLAPAVQVSADLLTEFVRVIATVPAPMLTVTALAGTMVIGFAAWHLGLKHIHNAMILAKGDILDLGAGMRKASISIGKGATGLVAANPLFAIFIGTVVAGAAAFRLFNTDHLAVSKQSAESAKVLGAERVELDKQVETLENLRDTLRTTVPESKARLAAERRLAQIMPGANLALSEQGELLAKVGDESSAGAAKLDEYINKLKEQSSLDLALQIEQQAKAFHHAKESVGAYSKNLVDWYGIGEESTSWVQDTWRGVNRLTGTYDKNIEKGGELRENLREQTTGYEELIAGMHKAGVSADDLANHLDSIHMSPEDKAKILTDYESLGTTAEEVFQKVAQEAEEAARKQKEAAEAQKEAQLKALNGFEEAAKKAYNTAIAKSQEYADRVVAIDQKLKELHQSSEDKLRVMRRKTMTDEQAWNDERLQAEEKLAKARELIAQGGEANLKEAEALAKQSQEIYTSLQTEVSKTVDGQQQVVKSLEQTSNVAISGYKKSNSELEKIYTAQKKQASENLSGWQEITASIKGDLDQLTKDRDANIEITLDNLDDIKRRLNSLAEDRNITIAFGWPPAESSAGETHLATGGGVGEAFRNMLRGGFFPGFGGGDRRHVVAEDGEYMISKEKVQANGVENIAAVNNGQLNIKDLLSMLKAKAGRAIHANIGGYIQNGLQQLPIMMSSGGSVSEEWRRQAADDLKRLQKEAREMTAKINAMKQKGDLGEADYLEGELRKIQYRADVAKRKVDYEKNSSRKGYIPQKRRSPKKKRVGTGAPDRGGVAGAVKRSEDWYRAWQEKNGFGADAPGDDEGQEPVESGRKGRKGRASRKQPTEQSVTPIKIVELRFPNGSLRGSEASVESLLKQLEMAGLRA